MAPSGPRRAVRSRFVEGRHGDKQKLEPLLVRLPPDLLTELREFARAEDRSIAGILRSAARQFLADHDNTRRSA